MGNGQGASALHWSAFVALNILDVRTQHETPPPSGVHPLPQHTIEAQVPKRRAIRAIVDNYVAATAADRARRLAGKGQPQYATARIGGWQSPRLSWLCVVSVNKRWTVLSGVREILQLSRLPRSSAERIQIVASERDGPIHTGADLTKRTQCAPPLGARGDSHA
jgi:hypothetical protein